MQQRKLSWKWIAAIALVGIVVMLCGCGFLAVLVANSADTTVETNTRVAAVEITTTTEGTDAKPQVDTHATEVAAMVQATFKALDAQATATADAAPTAEPTVTIGPTNTPEPTNTPKPTNTLKPTIDLAETSYMTQIMTNSLECHDYLMDIATQSQKAGEDYTLMMDTNWQVETAIALVGIDSSCVTMRDISPVPPRFATLHSYTVLMSSEMEQMVDDYTYGVDYLDADRLMSAVEHMQKGGEYIDMMTAEIERLSQ